MSRLAPVSVLRISSGHLTTIRHRDSSAKAISHISHQPNVNNVVTVPANRIWVTHLVLVFSLDEQGKGKSHLGQLGDADPILRTVKLWGVVIFIN